MNVIGFYDVSSLISKFTDAYTVAGIIGLVAALKIFKYLALSKQLNTLWLTLSSAAPELFAFLFGYGGLMQLPVAY